MPWVEANNLDCLKVSATCALSMNIARGTVIAWRR